MQDAGGVEGVCGSVVGGASREIRGRHDRRDRDGAVDVNGKEVKRSIKGGKIRGGERNVVLLGGLEGRGVVAAEDERVEECTEIEVVVVLCGGEVGGVCGLEGDRGAVGHFHGDLAGAVELVVVEVVELCVRLENVVHSDAVASGALRLVDGNPDGHAVGVVCHHDIAVVHECINKTWCIIAAVESAIEKALRCTFDEVGAIKL